MLTPQNKSDLNLGLSLNTLKKLGLTALVSLFMMTSQSADAQVVSKKDAKKSHEQMIKTQENYFNEWVAYIEGEGVREFFTKEIAKYKSDDNIFDSKVLKSSESTDPVLRKKEIVDKALAEAMKLFKKDLETWVIGFNTHIADENSVHAVKGKNANGYGHGSHGYVANVGFFKDNKQAFGKKGVEKKSMEYDKFLDATFKEFKTEAESLRNADQGAYPKWLPAQTAATYKAVEDKTRELLESIFDVTNEQVFSTKNHVSKKK